MATGKVKFRAYSNSDKEGTLHFQIIHNRITRQIHTGYKLFQYEWETRQSEIILSGSDTLRTDYLISLKEALAAATLKLKGIITR